MARQELIFETGDQCPQGSRITELVLRAVLVSSIVAVEGEDEECDINLDLFSPTIRFALKILHHLFEAGRD
jgi:hypothetical protein